MPKFKPFAELPPRLQAKIQTPPAANEVTHHWIWKGAVTPAAHRTVSSPRGTVHRKEERALQYSRARPNWHYPKVGYPVPAHRAVWCEATESNYRTMPEVRRCTECLCVNPHHLTVTGDHRLAPEKDYRPKPPKETAEQLWELLTTRTPNPDLSVLSAADELNVTSIPTETWAQYQTWCIENYTYPEEDD